MAKIRVIARFVAQSGKGAELKSVLQQMLRPTLSEKGCEYYELFEAEDGEHFYFNELWTTQEDLNVHAASPHFHELIVKGTKGLLREPLEVSLVAEILP